MLPVVALVALTTAANAFSPLLASASVKAYKTAVASARKGKAAQAAAILDGLLLRRKVRIAIDPSGAPQGREGDYIQGIRDGVDLWSDALDESPFALVAPGDKADLTVKFVKSISKNGTSDLQGAINAERRFFWNGATYGYELNGAIQIRNNAYGHTITGVEAGRVMAHELGHLLGLADNYESHGIMGAFRLGEGRVRPVNDEISAVSEFRDELRNAARKTLSR